MRRHVMEPVLTNDADAGPDSKSSIIHQQLSIPHHSHSMVAGGLLEMS